MAHQISHNRSLTNLQQPGSKDGKRRDEPRGNEPQEAKRMSAKNRGNGNQTQQVRLRPHGRWADKIIKLAQCQLSDAERQEVEDHLKGCAACNDAYLLYRGVSSLVRDVPPPKVPAGLPPLLQHLKQKVAAQDKQNARPRPTRTSQTLRDVTDNQPQQQEPVHQEGPLATRPGEDTPAEKETHPAVEEDRRILRSAKGPSHSKKGTKMV